MSQAVSIPTARWTGDTEYLNKNGFLPLKGHFYFGCETIVNQRLDLQIPNDKICDFANYGKAYFAVEKRFFQYMKHRN